MLTFFYLLIIERNPSEIPSNLLDKNVPKFETESLLKKERFISSKEFGNEIILVNFFATWCLPCRDEHIYIKRFSNEKGVRVIGINYVALQGNFLIYDEKKNIIAKLKPEYRFYPITNNFTTEASIHTNLFRDLYIVLGEGNLNDGWVVRIYYNPLVIWIWIGSLIIFIGGIVSMNIILRKLKILSQ